MRLNIGDKVRVTDDREGLGVKNKIGIIENDDKSFKPYRVYFADMNEYCWFCEDQLELANKKPTKQELLDMPVGTKIYTNAENKDYQEFIKNLIKTLKERKLLFCMKK